MASTSTLFDARWASGKHVGAAKPVCHVYTRRGEFRRGYFPWVGDDVRATIPGTSANPWQANWTPLEAYREIPNVLEVRIDHNFEQKGTATFSIDIDNIVLVRTQGSRGEWYHKITRGYLSPTRGWVSPGFPGSPGIFNPGEWYGALWRNVQVTVWFGYGEDTVTPAFTGLVDKVDSVANPTRITLTGRCFGKVLTDQKLYGYVKDKALKDPIIFSSKEVAQVAKGDSIQKIYGRAIASSSTPDSPPKYATDTDKNSAWRSKGHEGPNVTEWLDMHIPSGMYEDFYLEPQYDNLLCYISLHAKHRAGGKKPLLNGKEINAGWVDGQGTVPGANGGVPYIKVFTCPRAGHYHTFGEITSQVLRQYSVGDDSVIRLSFRNLQKGGDGKYHAGIRRFIAVRHKTPKDTPDPQWIIVNDAADIVKVILRWAGFKEWTIEQTGVKLKDKIVFNRNTSMMDVIQKVADTTGYVFFIDDPNPSNDLSIGVPTFRQNRTVRNLPIGLAKQAEAHLLLTGLQQEIDEEPLAWPIRVRGALITETVGKGKKRKKVHHRAMAYYNPPWASSFGGVIKHEIHYDPLLKSDEECMYTALFIALAMALEANKGSITIPGNCAPTLDEHFAVLDYATSIASRIYNTGRSHVFTRGENAKWETTISGTLIDSEDVFLTVRDFVNLMSDTAGGGPLSLNQPWPQAP